MKRPPAHENLPRQGASLRARRFWIGLTMSTSTTRPAFGPSEVRRGSFVAVRIQQLQ